MRRGVLPALLFLLAAGGTLFLGARILESERSSAERTTRNILRARIKEAESALVAASAKIRSGDRDGFDAVVYDANVFAKGNVRRTSDSPYSRRWMTGSSSHWDSSSLEPRPLERLLGTGSWHEYAMQGEREGDFYLLEAEKAEAVDGDLDRAATLYELAAAPERGQLIRLVAQYRAAALERRRGNLDAAKAYEAKFLFNIDVMEFWEKQVGTLEDLVICARSADSPRNIAGPLLQAVGSPDEAVALGLLRESGQWSDEAVQARRAELGAWARLRPLASVLPAMPAEKRGEGWGVNEGRLVSWSRINSPIVPSWSVQERPIPPLPEGVRIGDGRNADPADDQVNETLEAGVPPMSAFLLASIPRAEVEAEARRGAWLLGGALAALVLAGGAALALSVRAARRETEAARARADFVTKIGHDLRTPLAVVRMYAETLAAGKVADPAEAREFAGIAAREAERLTGMVGQVLDLSRVAEPALPRSPLDLAAVAAEVAEVHRPLLEHAGIRLDIRAAGPLPVLGDSASLRGAVSNLLENAGRHAGSGGSVEIESARDGTMAVVRVLDRGPGLPEGMEDRVFERFVRGPQAAGSGAGLGLALVREAAEAHGGSARASNREGGGAVFTVSVPLAEEEA